MRHRISVDGESPARQIEVLAIEALGVASKAKKHHQNLSGSNFYADKLADLRIQATNAFADLQSGTSGDTTALAELIETAFAAKTKSANRKRAVRDLEYALRTTWRESKPRVTESANGDSIFPSTLLQRTKRGYLIAVGRQANECFSRQLYDACAVMMRRLLETSIIEAFEGLAAADTIKDADGNYLQLSALVNASLAEPILNLSRNTKAALPKLRDFGHLSAHSRRYTAQKSDLESVQLAFRVAVEELLSIAGLI